MKEKSRLTWLRYSHMGNHYSSYHWYRCECGNEKLIRKSSVDRGSTRSCGCLQRENGRRAMARMPEELKGKGGGRKPGFTGSNVNKGKIRIMVNGRRKHVTEQELAEMYYSGGE